MTRWAAEYSAGTWLAVCTERIWMLADLDPDERSASALWNALLVDDDVDRLLDVLLLMGVRALPGFAVVAREGAALRVVVRGPAQVLVDGRHDALTNAPGTPWLDTVVTSEPAGVALLGVDGPAGSLPGMPLTRGVARAGHLQVEPVAETAAAPPRPEPPPAQRFPVHAAPPARALPDALVTRIPEPAPAPAPAPAPPFEALPVDADLGTSTDFARLRAVLNPTAEPAPGQGRASEHAPSVWSPEPAPAPVDDEQQGATSDLTATWSAFEPADAGPPPAAPGHAPAPPPPRPPEASPVEPPGLITGVPWATSSVTEERNRRPARRLDPPRVMKPPAPVAPLSSEPVMFEPPAGRSPGQGAHAEAESNPAFEFEDQATVRTVSRAELTGSGAHRPRVLAVRCSAGHLGPADAPTCWVCGLPVPGQQPVEVARPVLGRLRLSTGESVELDKDVVIGRAPQPTAENPVVRPNLIRLGNEPEISRNHVEIRLDGWHVLVRDLGSSNGTTLSAPGAAPVALNATQDYPLVAGSAIDLAEVVTVTFEVDR